MSNFVTEAFVQEYNANFLHVAQQKQSRLESAVTVESGIVGMSKSFNRLGQRVALPRLTRHGDSPINDQLHSTRFVDLFDYEDGDMIDDQDKIRMLTDPSSQYVNAMVAAFNRKKDDVIISALAGSARTAQAGTTVALPAGQKIVVGGTGLTRAKIIQAKKLFRTNEADEEAGEELYMLYNSTALADVLVDNQLTSADYLAVQMLQAGTLKGSWMGFRWIPTERCPKVSSTRSLFAFAKSGVVLGIGEDIKAELGKDPTKGFNYRAYAKMSIGAVRIEEEKVVQIDCNDP